MLKLQKLQPQIYMRPSPIEPVHERRQSFRTAGQPVKRTVTPVASKRQRKLSNAASKGVNFIDRATRLPGKISDLGDRLNDRFISIAEDLQAATEKFSNQGAAVAEKNLKENKIRSIGRQAFAWIQDNMALAGGIALVLAFVIYRGVTK